MMNIAISDTNTNYTAEKGKKKKKIPKIKCWIDNTRRRVITYKVDGSFLKSKVVKMYRFAPLSRHHACGGNRFYTGSI